MPESKTCLGFDFGMKRIGVAVGQTLLKTATPLDTLTSKQGKPNWDAITKLIKQWEVDVIVVGIPLNMDGTEQAITYAAKQFANQCRKQFSIPVYGIDERLTTVEARQQIFEEGGYRALKQSQVDSIAAKIILETWMNSQP